MEWTYTNASEQFGPAIVAVQSSNCPYEVCSKPKIALCCSGDVYVGAFLQKDTPEGAGAAKPGERLKASSLHPIGTFAHVHTIHYGSGAQNGTAMVLLVGHRRLKLEKTV